MARIKKGLTAIFMLCCFVPLMLLAASPAAAVSDVLPTAKDNLTVEPRSISELVATDNGYMRVFFDREQKKIGIEYYNDDFQIQSKRSLEMELPTWGGFYAGSDAYYLIEGKSNTDQNDSAEVIRVIKYDKEWNRQGAASITGNPKIFGGEVRYPFLNGCVEAAEHNGTLYIVTGHEGYVDPAVGQGHQGFLMITVDEAAMTGKIAASNLLHSFAQYITFKGSDLYVLEQSEGLRATWLSKFHTDNLKTDGSFCVLKYGGSRTSPWAISCYASVDGMALSSDNVLGLGTSIDQSQYDSVSSSTAHNIYLTVTPMSNFSEGVTTVKWLTNYSGDGKAFLGAKITKVNDNRFLISWEEHKETQAADIDDGLSASILHYRFIDGEGNPISREFTAAAPISDCQPIVKGSKIVYHASNANMVNFYSIDAENGAFSKKVYRVIGENAVWDLDKGVLTISGTGPMSFDSEAHYRYPISTASHAHSFSSSDNAWKPIKEHVKKIVVCGGITDISEKAFKYFNKLTEVELEPGVKSIGKEAFCTCENLSKITIPSSVTSLGEDFLWSGYYSSYDGRHLASGTIYAPENSYAANYAKENKIRFEASDKPTEGSSDRPSEEPSNKPTDSSSEAPSDKPSDKPTDSSSDKPTDSSSDRPSSTPGDKPGVSPGDSSRVSISPAKISGLKGTYVYNGKNLRPNVAVKLGNKVLKKGTDYTVSYANNKNTGQASVIITGINQYKGTITKAFRIIPKKPAISKAMSPKAKNIRVTWKKDSQASGYQLQYARNARFTSEKRVINIGKTSTTVKKISNLKKGKKYYVRIRAYKRISGTTYYSSWSKPASVKCK